jgi:hypothetical protein
MGWVGEVGLRHTGWQPDHGGEDEDNRYQSLRMTPPKVRGSPVGPAPVMLLWRSIAVNR